MAKKMRQQFADRYRGRISFGSNASTAVFETFNTGMNVGARDPYKWVLIGACIGPNSSDDIPVLNDPCDYFAQIAIGTQTAFLNGDDMQVVTQVGWMGDVATSGGFACNFPYIFPVLSPLPIFASQITIGMQGVNGTSHNDKEWWYELVYVPSPTQPDEVVEYLAAYGQV